MKEMKVRLKEEMLLYDDVKDEDFIVKPGVYKIRTYEEEMEVSRFTYSDELLYNGRWYEFALEEDEYNDFFDVIKMKIEMLKAKTIYIEDDEGNESTSILLNRGLKIECDEIEYVDSYKRGYFLKYEIDLKKLIKEQPSYIDVFFLSDIARKDYEECGILACIFIECEKDEKIFEVIEK